MFWIFLVVLLFAMLFLLARASLSLIIWLAVLVIADVALALAGMNLPVAVLILLLIGAVGVLFAVEEIRLKWVSRPLKNYIRKSLPPMSDTEKAAIEAGTVWWDGELFRGKPNFSRLLDTSKPTLSEEERAFLDGPTETLCAMLDDWRISHELRDLPADAWVFIRKNHFLAMVIPKQYGGLAFSAYAHSCVLQKIASRSAAAVVTVMVPNSLGPAELLLAYGTDAQKDYYLPRLAAGDEVPCFALTGPMAGSDASAIPDTGIVCRSEFEGEGVLGLRLNWEKRYITLGPVATVLGLAFHVYDPEHLLGEQTDLGITCALIPTDMPGIEIGRRHDPLNIAFMNGPNSGTDVFIPMDHVIGGEAMIGKGWRMLVERLSIGRGISLPSMSVAAGKMCADSTGAYARLRKQFHTSIGRFEGVQEALARIAGLTYLMDAGERLTVSALDAGEKPAVVTAIVKRYLTENMRQVVNDAMDVHGGRGICMGPSNYLGRLYQAVPVAITVEGANILTRSLMIFGQGAMRCHPYLQEEVAAATAEGDEGLHRFDMALLSHAAYTIANAARAVLYGVAGGLFAPAPVSGPSAQYYRRIARYSAATSAMADLALMTLGGTLKRKEAISGRFADAMAWMYLCSAVLKRFEDDGRQHADEPLMHWACQHSLYQVQQALDGVIRNFPIRPIAWKMRVWAFPLGRRASLPGDKLMHQLAELLIEPSATRERLVDGLYTGDDGPIKCLHQAMELTIRAEPIERKLKEQGKVHRLDQDYGAWLRELLEAGALKQAEADVLSEARASIDHAVMVDDFPADEWG